MKKKLLLLGGLRYLLPVIEAAHELGLHVITCDYIPENIAHKYSDEYHNISIIDKDAVLELAKKLKIDGIMSFAVDPGVLTAAYVAEKMNLPGLPYDSVRILQNKGLFRKFLTDNGFNVPTARSYISLYDSEKDLDLFHFPVIVKPVDSAGSKGVRKVIDRNGLTSAVKFALENSHSKEFIIEDFIEKDGFSSDSDSFSIDGELKFISFSNQHFDTNAANPYTPSAYSWPSTISENNKIELKNELQRLISLLDLGSSVYNIETRVGINGKTYIMEVSPRGGGNRLCEMIRLATGLDLIKNAVKAAIGDKTFDIVQKEFDGYWSEVILHSNTNGNYDDIYIDPIIKEKNLIELDLWLNKGDRVTAFRAANDTIGTLVLRFDTPEQLEKIINSQKKWLKIIVTNE